MCVPKRGGIYRDSKRLSEMILNLSEICIPLSWIERSLYSKFQVFKFWVTPILSWDKIGVLYTIETISNLIKNTTSEKITQFKDVEGRDIELSIKNGYADAKVNGFSVGITFDKHTIKRMLNNLNKKAEKKVVEALAKMKAKHN